jgi:hypothetical protein
MNFALILFILVIVSGIAWIADKLYFAPQRVQAGIARMPLWVGVHSWILSSHLCCVCTSLFHC